MIILRCLLYIICVLSIGWSVLVFGGPTLIKHFIKKYSNNSIIASNIRVSPLFDVSIGRIDFRIAGGDAGTSMSGFSRSTEISWSLSDEQSFLTFDIGPTFLKDILTAENVVLQTNSYNKFNFQELPFDLQAKSVTFQGLAQINSLFLTGRYDSKSNKIHNISFDAKRLRVEDFNMPLRIGLLNGTLGEIQLNSQLSDQTLNIDFIANDVGSDEFELRISEVNGLIDNSKLVKNIKFDLLGFQFPRFGGSVNEIKVDADFDKNGLFQNAKMDFFDGSLTQTTPNFSGISTKIVKSDDERYQMIITGKFMEFEMYNSRGYLGLLPPSTLNSVLNLDSASSKIISRSTLTFDPKETSNVSGIANFDISFSENPNVLDCLLANCEASFFDLAYRINVSDEWIKGRASCAKSSCKFHGISHTLTTSNTVKILTDLSQARILTPFTSAYLFTAISSGKKSNDGHQLNF